MTARLSGGGLEPSMTAVMPTAGLQAIQDRWCVAQAALNRHLVASADGDPAADGKSFVPFLKNSWSLQQECAEGPSGLRHF
jgi:hypothetical protein